MQKMLRLIKDNAEPIIMFLFTLALFAIVIFGAGCSSLCGDGAKVVEGTDLTLGVSLPYSEASDAMTLINYLTGFRLTVDETSRCKLKYTCCETNDYFGMVTTRIAKSIEADIEPTIDESEESEEEKPAENADLKE